MSLRFKRNAFFFVIISVVLILAFALLGITVAHNGALANDTWTQLGSVKVGHLTDTHYYPTRFSFGSNEGENPRATNDPDYFYNDQIARANKLCLESAAVMEKSMETLLRESPDYLLVSGDIAEDGELEGLIDMANRLRKLQNQIREKQGSGDFQIFVVFGNHDLYNPASYRFDNPLGLRENDFYTTRIDAVRIFAGLGYPNMTEAEADLFYAPIYAKMSAKVKADFKFVPSNLSTRFEYRWQFLKNQTTAADISKTFQQMLGLDLVTLKYTDNQDRFGETRMSYSYTYFSEAGKNDDASAYLSGNRDYRDLYIGDLTTLAIRDDGKVVVAALDVVLSNVIGGHVLGGQVQESTKEFLTKNYAETHRVANPIILGTAHHSILPHFSMQEQILTGFIVYNWEEAADFLADYGMRYIYTGHVHANNVVSRISFNGNQITDMQTAADVGTGSQVKITDIRYGTYGGAYAEKSILSAFENKVVPLVDLGINRDPENIFDKYFLDDRFGYIKANNLAQFIDIQNKAITDFSRYSAMRMFRNLVPSVIDAYLKPDVTKLLASLVHTDFISGETLKLVADNLIKYVNTVVLRDYTYGGENPNFKGNDGAKLFAFIEEAALSVFNQKVAGDLTMLDAMIDIYLMQINGEDVTSLDKLDNDHKLALAKIKNGALVDGLLALVLDRQKGLYRIIDGIINGTINLKEGTGTSLNALETTIKLVIPDFSFTAVRLADIIPRVIDLISVLSNFSSSLKSLGSLSDTINSLGIDFTRPIMQIADEYIEKYLTESLKSDVSEILYNILASFAVNVGQKDVNTPYVEGVSDIKDHLLAARKENAELLFTYIDKAYVEEVSLENGKLPSMLTTNFGENPATTQAFTYFTDRRVKEGQIDYRIGVDGAVTSKAFVTETFALTKPLIDLGIWGTMGYVEKSRHTITLTDLLPDTVYYYRVGTLSKVADAKIGGFNIALVTGGTASYYTPWFSFRTAPAKTDAPFDALITSDLQSSTQSAYERIGLVYDEIFRSNLFNNGIAFRLDAGDTVDNSRNLKQYEWLLNSRPYIYASISTVVSVGNHEDKFFEFSKASNANEYGSRDKKFENYEYNYLWSHYNYALKENQLSLSGFYYSFDYSGVHFTVLNTNDIEDFKLGSVQYQWLLNDLKTTDKKFKVVLMHKSMYSAGAHSYDRDVIGLRTQLTPVFSANGVHLVIAGHDHTYTETYYLDKNGKKLTTNANGRYKINDNGTMYLTMGTMGEKYYNYVDNKNVAVSTGKGLHDRNGTLNDPTFGMLSFDGTDLYYYGYQFIREYNSNGDVIGGKIALIEKAPMSINAVDTVGFVVVGTALLAVIGTVVFSAVKKKKV